MEKEDKTIKKESSLIKETFEQVNDSALPVKKEKIITLRFNSSFIIIAVLVILVAVSVVQAIELNTLKSKISTGEVQAATTSSTGSATGSSGSTQSTNLQDLPQMVGGC